MATATPIPSAHLALLAGIDITVCQLPMQDTSEHPLGIRADRHTRTWAPVTADELDHLETQVETTRTTRPHSLVVGHAEGALAGAFTLAGCDLPVTATGSEMTWATGVDVTSEVVRATRYLRGEELPPRRQQQQREFVRPSQRGQDPNQVAAEHRRAGRVRGR